MKKKSAVKTVILVILAFAAGFVFHAFFFPTLEVEDAGTLIGNESLRKIEGLRKNDANGFNTQVSYKNGSFNPSSVTIKKGNYITITNENPDDQDLMWLQSRESLLTTVRGYATSEQVYVSLNELGEFEVVNKLNPKAKLMVKVE